MPSLEDGEPYEGFPQTTAADDYGTVYYEVDTFNYFEQWVPSANRTIINCRVLADDAYRFRTAMVGRTYLEGGVIKRQIPEANPFVTDEDGNFTQWCTRLEQIDQGAENTDGHFQDETRNYWPYTGWVRYRATFEGLPFRVRDNSSAAGFEVPELSRYVVRGQQTYAREQQIPGGGFVPVGGDGKLMQTGFKTRVYGKVTYTVYRWPVASIPSAWRSLRGLINDALFDDSIQAGPGGYRWEAGELLYEGYDDNEKYFDANGDWVADVVLAFRFCQGGWNFFLDKHGTLHEVTSDGTTGGTKPYSTGDFKTLFAA
jgi:hypothetical protein